MADFWEARITRITVADDQSQIFELVFQQRVDTEPDVQILTDWYGASLHNPPPLPSMMMARSVPDTSMATPNSGPTIAVYPVSAGTLG
jgi:hypothetical protein